MAELKRDRDDWGDGEGGGKAARRDELAPFASLIERGGRSCSHQVAWAPGSTPQFSGPPPPFSGPPAHGFAFELDCFQQTAIDALEAGHSALVAAHTSSGKTAVAEYAFGMALRDKARAIYTTPLKALSHQKYRALVEQFGDVGLLTGDVTINPDAALLVMTTEVLRQMVYAGSADLAHVSHVVFDEVHYLSDAARGVVWEEAIVLAPRSVRFLFLSATVPNGLEFALWVAKIHEHPCHVVTTDFRATPLTHFIYPTGGNALYQVIDEQQAFKEEAFANALRAASESAPGRAGAAGGRPDKQGADLELFLLVKLLALRQWDPALVFCFSRLEAERLAASMPSIDMASDADKAAITAAFVNATECLSAEEQRLPQVSGMLRLLRRGIGIHHSGLLPVIKDLVEQLFQAGRLRVLLVTETFAAGLHMPARTVVFTKARKFDGAAYRGLSPSEYTQMSGRAGRRGLDDRGIVILMVDASADATATREMMRGAVDPLRSAFHLGFNMLLNVAQLPGGVRPEHLVAASFRQFQLQRALPDLKERAVALQAACDAVAVADEGRVEGYMRLLERFCELTAELRAVVTTPRHSLPFLQPGRLVRVLPQPRPPTHALPAFSEVSDDEVEAAGEAFGNASAGGLAALANGGVWAAVVAFEQMKVQDDAAGSRGSVAPDAPAPFLVDILVNTEGGGGGLLSHGPDGQRLQLLPAGAPRGQPQVVSVPLSHIDAFSSVRVYIYKDLRSPEARQASMQCVALAVSRCSVSGGRVPVLDVRDDIKVKDSAVGKLVSKLESTEHQLRDHKLAASPDLRARLAALQQKAALEAQAKAERRQVRQACGQVLTQELESMTRTLRRLKLVGSDGKVTHKGQVAASLSVDRELVLCELLFNGAFDDMSPQQLLAACSCFVCDRPMQLELEQVFRPVLATVDAAARRVAKASSDKEEVEGEARVLAGTLHPTLMGLVCAWSQGARLGDLLKMTTLLEGDIIRVMKRLNGLLKDVHRALQAAGDTHLAGKFEAAKQSLQRSVLLSSSLYS
ncbi:hypothetical protein FOA52_014340 [Chlamydomonas sp. UWO 241]|nr:hypothetical protein FOA52_014340 [Chlamydomonas sp. UWO 241]